jgi:hypothetical protein
MWFVGTVALVKHMIRPMPDGLATVEDVKQYSCTSSHTHHRFVGVVPRALLQLPYQEMMTCLSGDEDMSLWR